MEYKKYEITSLTAVGNRKRIYQAFRKRVLQLDQLEQAIALTEFFMSVSVRQRILGAFQIFMTIIS